MVKEDFVMAACKGCGFLSEVQGKNKTIHILAQQFTQSLQASHVKTHAQYSRVSNSLLGLRGTTITQLKHHQMCVI